MKKHLGNLVSWSSVLVMLITYYTKNPLYLAIGICIACFMDMFDGKFARMYGENTKSAKIFGELTDSLCDLVNFGVAPSLLMTTLQYGTETSFLHLFFSFFYIWAGIYRLARFSATKTQDCVDYYTGLPITVAGPILAFASLLTDNQFIVMGLMLVTGYAMVCNVQVKKLKI